VTIVVQVADAISRAAGTVAWPFETVVLLGFVVWNLGVRQGRRGASIGKSMVRLRVVDVDTLEPTGAGRGVSRCLTHGIVVTVRVLRGNRSRQLKRPSPPKPPRRRRWDGIFSDYPSPELTPAEVKAGERAAHRAAFRAKGSWSLTKRATACTEVPWVTVSSTGHDGATPI